jgi:hypothetical protein
MRRTLRLAPTFGLFAVFLALLTLTVFAASCAPRADIAPGQTIALASSSENGVDVSVTLERTSEEVILLHATFTPPDGNHLYSKDIPITGVDGLGRPTLLELTVNSKMQALGSLGESVPAIELDFEYQKLPIYPAGPVTLTLPIALPPGTGWVDDVVSVTYMACNDTGCKPPVLGKIITVRVPGADSISQ